MNDEGDDLSMETYVLGAGVWRILAMHHDMMVPFLCKHMVSDNVYKLCCTSSEQRPLLAALTLSYTLPG